MHKIKKISLIIISSIVILVVAVILFISPIAKYFVIKFGEKFTGRQITMDRLYLNPLTGFVEINNLKIYELNSDSVFFSADNIGASIALRKLLSKTYEIRKLNLYHPKGTIIQNEKELNFNDLIDKFSPKDTIDTIKAPVHFSILSLKIYDGEFHYREQLIPINYFIKKVNIESSGLHWDTDTVHARFSLLPGTGNGDMNGDLTINLKTNDYRLALVTHKFDLGIIQQYLKDLSNYGSFSANIDADIKAKGNLLDQEDITTSGMIAINEFHFGKNPKVDFASFDKLVMAISELSPKKLIYSYDSITISRPCVTYEIYDYLDNLQTMFGVNGSTIDAVSTNTGKFNLIIEIARYVKVLSKSFFRSDYKINRVRIYKADLKFNDFSTTEKFAVELNPLNVIADSIDKDHKRVNLSLQSTVKPYGSISVNVSINPKDSTDFDLQYHLNKLPVALFNPYIISSTSFPLDRGTLEFNGIWNVRNGLIKSVNHLVIIDPRTSKRIRNKDTKWIPVPLIMTFIRDRGNVIDYEIPITGNLKDPKFHVHDVIVDLLKNIFVKPPTTPYRLQVKNIETEIEKSLTLKWETRYSSLLPVQEKFIERIAEFLKKNPDASINVYPQQYAIKEKEYILFFEAKKKYFLSGKNKNAGSLSAEDSVWVDKMSVKDSLFVHYLNNHLKDSLIFTIQEKCASIVDSAFVRAKFALLNKKREDAFISYFTKAKVDNQVKFLKGENVVPYNGFSFYKIEYKGEFPEFLIKAYQAMNNFNNEAPRKKYKQERKKNESNTLK